MAKISHSACKDAPNLEAISDRMARGFRCRCWIATECPIRSPYGKVLTANNWPPQPGDLGLWLVGAHFACANVNHKKLNKPAMGRALGWR
jgi:hypothetical protein